MTKERLYILIAGAILLLAGTIYRFYPQIESAVFLSENVEAKREALLQHQRMVRKRDQLEDRLEMLRRRLERFETGLLKGGTPALAAVNIQNIINDLAGTSRVEVQRMRVMEPEKPEDLPDRAGDYLNIPVQVSIRAGIRPLKEVLYRIESSEKILGITEIRIRAGSSGEKDLLYATFTVTGLMKTEAE